MYYLFSRTQKLLNFVTQPESSHLVILLDKHHARVGTNNTSRVGLFRHYKSRGSILIVTAYVHMYINLHVCNQLGYKDISDVTIF